MIMSCSVYPAVSKDNDPDYCKTCYRFGCSNKSSQKIEVSAGTYGAITLNLCNKCVDFFQGSNTSSSRGIVQK